MMTDKIAKLLSRLDDELHREAASWHPQSYDRASKRQLAGEDRDKVVVWLAELNHRFQFHPETLALSVAMLDRILTTVKAHPKYLQCIGVSCFYIAAKTLEEDELLPVTTELVRESGCGRSVAEVNRMERQVLDKLHWDVRLATPLAFLQIFHALLLAHFPALLEGATHLRATEHFALLASKLCRQVACHRLLVYPPSTLAIALLSLELQAFRPDWLSITIVMQRLANVDSDALIRCQEAMTEGTRTWHRRSSGVVGVTPQTCQSRACQSRAAKRKVEEMQDDVYDDIRHLYSSEEPAPSTREVPCGRETVPCGREARQESAVTLLPATAAS